MADSIRTVAVIGAGVIGSSWACLFLAKGLKVLISDPAPESQKSFDDFLAHAWPTLEQLGLDEHASSSNYEFVTDIFPRLHEADYIQEVSTMSAASTPI